MKSGFCTLVDWLLIFAPRSYVWSADCCFLPKIGDIIHLKRNLHFLQRLCFSLFPMYCDCYRILKMALRFSFTAVKGVFSSGVWNSFSDLIYFVQFQDACPFWDPETKHTCSAISSKQTLPIVEAATWRAGSWESWWNGFHTESLLWDPSSIILIVGDIDWIKSLKKAVNFSNPEKVSTLRLTSNQRGWSLTRMEPW